MKDDAADIPQFLNSRNGQWNEERKRLLIEMYHRGYTRSRMGRELGTTKNSCVGKLNRMGLKVAPERVDDTVIRRRLDHRNELERGRRAMRKLEGKTAWKPRPRAEVLAQRVSAGAVTIADLDPGSCRWPLWASHGPLPSVHERFYCGAMAEEDVAYCARHCRVAWQGKVKR